MLSSDPYELSSQNTGHQGTFLACATVNGNVAYIENTEKGTWLYGELVKNRRNSN